jgi:hypothetical protein
MNFILFVSDSDPVFTKRGTVVIKSMQTKRATFSQVSSLSSEDRKLLRVTFILILLLCLQSLINIQRQFFFMGI